MTEVICPWCGHTAIDMTCAEDLDGFDQRARYLCVGPESHEWRDGDQPEPETKPLIVLARS